MVLLDDKAAPAPLSQATRTENDSQSEAYSASRPAISASTSASTELSLVGYTRMQARCRSITQVTHRQDGRCPSGPCVFAQSLPSNLDL